jgi:hypothetical protein
MIGWIKLYRKILDNPLWLSEPFTRAQAWIDLLLLANHKDSFFYVRGNKITVKRGEVGMSIRNLAERWQWSRAKVNRFINDLESEHQIEPQKNNITTLLSICNYNDYQIEEPQNEPQTEPQKSHKKATEKPQTLHKQEDKNNKENIPNGILKKDKLSFTDHIDYEALMRYFNETFKGKLKAITIMTQKRKQAVHARAAEHGKEAIQKAFNKILGSKFLLGDNDRNWQCNFDWIFLPTNFIKILEGNFDTKNGTNNINDLWKSD